MHVRAPARAAWLAAAVFATACSRLHAPDAKPIADVPPPAAANPPPTLPGLLSAAGGDGVARLDWFPDASAAPGLELALFAGLAPDDVYAGAPYLAPLAGDHLIATGLPVGTVLYAGLGAREVGASAWTPVGAVLSIRIGPPVYVSAAADAAVADGLTPATAYPDLASGILLAFSLGGANLWVAEGEFANVELPLFPGVRLAGGFPADFDLAARDPAAHKTLFRGAPGVVALSAEFAGEGVTIDGIELDGGTLALVGIDVRDTRTEIRRVRVRRFSDRGIRLRAADDSQPLDVRIAGSVSEQNGADGVSIAGAFALRIDSCRFDANGQEGIDCDDLVAPDGEDAELVLRDVLCDRNATDGLDADLSAPLAGGLLGGDIDVTIEGSRFEANGSEGLQVDLDFEAFPLWTADIEISGATCRANGLNGIRLDLDAPSTALVHRALADANRADGIRVSSETDAGFAFVSTSVAAGNLGAGIRASDGNRAVVASHCVVAGNAGGGLVSGVVESSAVSSVAWLQPATWTGVELAGSVAAADPLAPVFAHAPRAYGGVIGASGAVLTLSADLGALAGELLEIDDDDAALAVVGTLGAQVEVAPAPQTPSVPGAIALFAGGSVEEDYAIVAGSAAEGAGLVVPGAPAVDAGIWSSPTAGVPGTADAVGAQLFRPSATAPAHPLGVAAGQELRIRFHGGDLDPASASSSTVRAVSQSGTELAIGISVVADELVIAAPLAGWGSEPFRVELLDGLQAIGGTALCAPVVLALPAPP